MILIVGQTESIGSQLSAENRDARIEILEELRKAKDADGLMNTMKERFPSADLLLALERGARANVKP